jgi:hypothetical protein
MQRATVISLLSFSLATGCGSSAPQGWRLEDLDASAGFSLRLPEIDVASGAEVQDCYFVDTPDLAGGADYWVSRIEFAQNPGTHHLNIFRVKTIVKLDPAMGEPIMIGGFSGTVVRGGAPGSTECWKSPNWADWPLVANSQNSRPDSPYTDFELPKGVAMRMHPGEKLMLQSHYVNATTQKTPAKGKVGINWYRSSEATPTELGTLFATQQNIRVCRSNPTPQYSGACGFKTGEVHITAANGHFHSRGTRFSVFSWNGMADAQPPASDRFYESDRWDDPPMTFGLDVKPPSGGGVWWTCEYQWSEPSAGCAAVDMRDKQMAGDCCYTFGPVVESSEHCNVFVYYWPKVEKTDIFCN